MSICLRRREFIAALGGATTWPFAALGLTVPLTLFAFASLSQLDDAVADYDEALRRNPKQAGSLYGRGLAKLKKGDAVDGEADIAAAKAIRPPSPRSSPVTASPPSALLSGEKKR
jgi:hypothetical protein